MLADAQGRPLRFLLTGGQVHDSKTAADLLDGVVAGGVIADKAYDSNAIRQTIAAAGMTAVIPSNRSRKTLIAHDAHLYKNSDLLPSGPSFFMRALGFHTASAVSMVAGDRRSWSG